MPDVVLQSSITCPECDHTKLETMPTDACQYFYECTGCGAVLKPKQGDCCVFCSYGSVRCPPCKLAQAAALRQFPRPLFGRRRSLGVMVSRGLGGRLPEVASKCPPL
jgi:hypothetical protein